MYRLMWNIFPSCATVHLHDMSFLFLGKKIKYMDPSFGGLVNKFSQFTTHIHNLLYYWNKCVSDLKLFHLRILIFNLFIPAVLTENILKVWDSHKTQLYCGQIGLRFFIDLLVWQHVSTPSFGPSSGLQDVRTCSSQLLFVVTYI